MKKRHTVIPRTMCLVFHDGCVLLMKAGIGKDWAGKYDPLGGHIERGEDIIDCANREIQEESGLIVDNTELKGIIHVSNFYKKEIMMFVTVSYSKIKKVTANEEGNLKWVPVDQLDKYPIMDDLKLIISKIKKHKSGQILTGVSKFGDDGKLLSLRFSS